MDLRPIRQWLSAGLALPFKDGLYDKPGCELAPHWQ